MEKRKISRIQLLRIELEYFFSSFDKREIEDILIAWFVISFSFAYLLHPFFDIRFLTSLEISAIAVGFGFIIHEMMHKFVAISYDYPARFVAWPMGLFFTLFSALLFRFIFALPGATIFTPRRYEMFTGHKFKEKYGKISLAGPVSNIVLGGIFLIVLLFAPNAFIATLGYYGAFVNFYLSAFNMLPIPFLSLDGYKVWDWNKLIWAGVFVLSVIATGILYLGYI